ncbi:ribonuclease [Croceicoccus ponticola]|uniref:Ribonuclease n=1 Tax=Croceicoccus ponticola TaxID=2217664 RepID=A0A437GVW2_9SPHN|nr:ribonuclease [Croceicoccus ponticola]RVQ65992.1 ribonuclease [Croceicoccus ponticola]
MADWLVEDGIGEQRAILIASGAVVAAKVAWTGELLAGAVVAAKLVSRNTGSSRGTARLADGTELLVDRLPRDASEGATLTFEVTRAAIGEGSRRKLAQARPSERRPGPLPTLADVIAATGDTVQNIHRFTGGEWDHLWAEIAEGRIDFAGGSMLFSPTPAMTLIDIDGTLPPPALAIATVRPLAAALTRFDIGGSVGIDFPTLQTKADRRAVDEALEDALTGYPHERTAMNGFGFVQIVSRSTGPSLLHRFAADPAGCAARLLLRSAEAVAGAGAILLTCQPAVATALQAPWLDALARRTGREIRVRTDPALAQQAGFAQSVPI